MWLGEAKNGWKVGLSVAGGVFQSVVGAETAQFTFSLRHQNVLPLCVLPRAAEWASVKYETTKMLLPVWVRRFPEDYTGNPDSLTADGSVLSCSPSNICFDSGGAG